MRFKPRDNSGYPKVIWSKWFCLWPCWLDDTSEWAWLEVVWARKRIFERGFSGTWTFDGFYTKQYSDEIYDTWFK